VLWYRRNNERRSGKSESVRIRVEERDMDRFMWIKRKEVGD
jgi:hypothetical protein